MKKILATSASLSIIAAFSAIASSAATVKVPAAFDDLAYIFEIVLKLAEYLSKILSFFG